MNNLTPLQPMICPLGSVLRSRYVCRNVENVKNVREIQGTPEAIQKGRVDTAFTRQLSHSNSSHCSALHCTTLLYTALHCTALHCTALHCTAHHLAGLLHCTAVQYIALHCTEFN